LVLGAGIKIILKYDAKGYNFELALKAKGLALKVARLRAEKTKKRQVVKPDALE